MAILLREPERSQYLNLANRARSLAISAATLIETRVVCYRRGGLGLVKQADDLIETLAMAIVPVVMADIEAAFVRFGKGSGHPAQLNFGDLFSYALAKQRSVPLQFKGNDFAQTDIVQA